MTELQKVREKFKGCDESWEWVKENGFETIEQAWNACERGDWMIWMAEETGLVTRQELTLAACQCARLSLKFVPNGEDRPRIAIETAEAWARGEIGIEEVKLASYAAYAASAAYAVSKSYAASVAASAAASAASASSAAYASYAASAVSAVSAVYAVSAAADGGAKESTLKQCADLVRHLYKDQMI